MALLGPPIRLTGIPGVTTATDGPNDAVASLENAIIISAAAASHSKVEAGFVGPWRSFTPRRVSNSVSIEMLENSHSSVCDMRGVEEGRQRAVEETPTWYD